MECANGIEGPSRFELLRESNKYMLWGSICRKAH